MKNDTLGMMGHALDEVNAMPESHAPNNAGLDNTGSENPDPETLASETLASETLASENVASEDAWMSVIQKMDESYADLVHSQVEIEGKNAELEENKQFFDSIQSAMSDVLIVCDHDGTVQRVNAALETLVGQKQSALEGKHYSELMHKNYQQKTKSFLEQIRIQPVRDCELKLNGAKGSVPLSMNCPPRFFFFWLMK